MFGNLRTALQQKGVSMKQYAEVLGVGEKTAQNKLAGRRDFTYSEFKKTCALLFEYNADYLFTEKAAKENRGQQASCDTHLPRSWNTRFFPKFPS